MLVVYFKEKKLIERMWQNPYIHTYIYIYGKPTTIVIILGE